MQPDWSVQWAHPHKCVFLTQKASLPWLGDGWQGQECAEPRTGCSTAVLQPGHQRRHTEPAVPSLPCAQRPRASLPAPCQGCRVAAQPGSGQDSRVGSTALPSPRARPGGDADGHVPVSEPMVTDACSLVSTATHQSCPCTHTNPCTQPKRVPALSLLCPRKPSATCITGQRRFRKPSRARPGADADTRRHSPTSTCLCSSPHPCPTGRGRGRRTCGCRVMLHAFHGSRQDQAPAGQSHHTKVTCNVTEILRLSLQQQEM